MAALHFMSETRTDTLSGDILEYVTSLIKI